MHVWSSAIQFAYAVHSYIQLTCCLYPSLISSCACITGFRHFVHGGRLARRCHFGCATCTVWHTRTIFVPRPFPAPVFWSLARNEAKQTAYFNSLMPRPIHLDWDYTTKTNSSLILRTVQSVIMEIRMRFSSDSSGSRYTSENEGCPNCMHR